MAEWSSRDPRWLVQERADGSNVNRWHWQEKNKMPWSRQRLDELTSGLVAVFEEGEAKVTGLKDLTGEAYLTSRKGNKKFAVFDLAVTLSWAGRLAEDESEEVTGSVKITEFASVNDEDEYLFEVTTDLEKQKYGPLLAAIERLKPDFLKQLRVYVKELNAL